MLRITSRPYESEANYCSDSFITDKGTSISDDIRKDYSFQKPTFEFSDCWGFVDGTMLILVNENYEEWYFSSFRHDNTNNKVYLPDDNGGETWKEIVSYFPLYELKEMLYIGNNGGISNNYKFHSDFYYNHENGKVYEQQTYVGYNIGYENPYTGESGEDIIIHEIDEINNKFFINNDLKLEEAIFLLTKMYPEDKMSKIIGWAKSAINIDC